MPRRKEGLTVFDGFQADMACTLSDLSFSAILTLRKNGVVMPKKSPSGIYVYSFSDILMLRLIRTLKAMHVSNVDIREAHKFVKELDPTHDLTRMQLFIQRDSRQILGLCEENDDAFKRLDRRGQLVSKQLIQAFQVGKYLEETRKRVIRLDKNVSDAHKKNVATFSLEEVKRRHGIA
jgi:DNA-binding transcriptional MerR regulator